MIISTAKPKIFWNYFIALEEDLIEISRFIELNRDNDDTYSIELVKLLLSASSEVDVVLKAICGFDGKDKHNIDEYREKIVDWIPEFLDERVYIRRFELELWPWQNWKDNKNPDWWHGYNNVKHNRSEYYKKANLNFTINAMAGLLVSIFWYYKLAWQANGEVEINNPMDITLALQPKSRLLYLKDELYYGNLLV